MSWYPWPLNIIIQNQGKIMSALSDLQAAVTNITTAVNAAAATLSELAAKVATLPSTDDADSEQIAGQLNTLSTSLNAAVAATGTTPPATPTP